MHRMIFSVLVSFSLAISLMTSGCATVVHGTNQQIAISSEPAGATVRVNGQVYGVTPLVLNLRRKEIHILQLELDGHQPYELTLERAISAWTAANYFFGDGLIFAGLDGMDGAFYRLYPEEVVATLSPSKTRPPVVSESGANSQAVAQQLIDLKELYDAGVLSPEDYEARRAHLLPLL